MVTDIPREKTYLRTSGGDLGHSDWVKMKSQSYPHRNTMPIEIYNQNYSTELAKEVSEGNQNTYRSNLMNSNES